MHLKVCGIRRGINGILFLLTPVVSLFVKAHHIEWAFRQMLIATLRASEAQVAKTTFKVRVNKHVSAANQNNSILKGTLVKKKKKVGGKTAFR